MINTSVNKNEHTIQSGVVDYPIGFPFYFNPDRTPQLLVKIGDEELRFNHNFELSEDKGSVVLRPTEEESWTLEGPEDFSWMTKWDGKDLLIERAVPFVQDSDYQLGRISSEQIERDFDLSVMRDQILAGRIKEHVDDVQGEIDTLRSRIDSVQEEHVLDMAAVDKAMATKATKTELESAKTVLGKGVQDNADAIQETRAESRAADSEIRQTLDNHTDELTTLRGNQASLGDQVSGIEEKIPESASGSNPLVTKQQLATKQDQLTAGDNIIISNNVISATGAGGGAGLDMVVVDQLPETGQKGTLYFVKKDGTAPDVHDEYVWITATQTFELIGTTRVDLTNYAKKEELNNYLPLSGGTLTGATNFDIGTSSYSDVPIINGGGKAIISLSTGLGGIPNGGIRVANGVVTTGQMYAAGGFGNKYSPTIAWLKTINNGADIAIPTTGGTMALAENVETAIADAVANIDALPDQSGNAGKVLTTDGSKASWQEPQGGGTKVIIKRYE